MGLHYRSTCRWAVSLAVASLQSVQWRVVLAGEGHNLVALTGGRLCSNPLREFIPIQLTMFLPNLVLFGRQGTHQTRDSIITGALGAERPATSWTTLPAHVQAPTPTGSSLYRGRAEMGL
jgi:hypothetical protein